MFNGSNIFRLVLILTVTILLGSCKKDVLNSLNPYGNCEKLSNDFSTAYEAYLTNPTVTNCETLVDAYEDFLNGCSGWGLWNTAYDNFLDDVDCSQEGQ